MNTLNNLIYTLRVFVANQFDNLGRLAYHKLEEVEQENPLPIIDIIPPDCDGDEAEAVESLEKEKQFEASNLLIKCDPVTQVVSFEWGSTQQKPDSSTSNNNPYPSIKISHVKFNDNPFIRLIEKTRQFLSERFLVISYFIQPDDCYEEVKELDDLDLESEVTSTSVLTWNGNSWNKDHPNY